MENAESLSWSLHSDQDVARLGRALERLAAAGKAVYVDVGAYQPPPTIPVRQVGSDLGTGGRIGSALGAKYPSYYTAEVRSTDDLIGLADAARPTGELRVRVFDAIPPVEVVEGWSPREFWDTSRPRPEEAAASIVASVENGGTGLRVLSRSGETLLNE